MHDKPWWWCCSYRFEFVLPWSLNHNGVLAVPWGVGEASMYLRPSVILLKTKIKTHIFYWRKLFLNCSTFRSSRGLCPQSPTRTRPRPNFCTNNNSLLLLSWLIRWKYREIEKLKCCVTMIRDKGYKHGSLVGDVRSSHIVLQNKIFVMKNWLSFIFFSKSTCRHIIRKLLCELVR